MRGSRFKFCGPAYTAADTDQDAQELINWFVEKSQSEDSKEPVALLGAPGLQQIASTATAEVRGGWVMPGGDLCLIVSGSNVYALVILSPATSTARPTYRVQLVGTIGSTQGPVIIRDNGPGGVAVIVDGSTSLYVFSMKTWSVSMVKDPGYLGASHVTFVNGWFTFNDVGSQKFYTSPLYWDGVAAFDPTYFALKDSSTDNLVAVIESLQENWLIGERTTEIWYLNPDNATFPLSRLQGVTLQIGCQARYSVTRFGLGLAWLARSERGENIVVKTEGYQHTIISTQALSDAISKYPVTSDAVGYAYTEGGHTFYVLTFPTADVTWVFDAASGQWHKRASFDVDTGEFHRQRANCCVSFQHENIVGDYQDGALCRMTRDVFDDNGRPLVALRRAPYVWDGGERERVFHSSLQIQFRAGVGLQTGQGSAPQIMLRWSDDNGRRWSNERAESVGAAGETLNRCIWRLLGSSRARIYEARISDPVQRDVAGATLVAE